MSFNPRNQPPNNPGFTKAHLQKLERALTSYDGSILLELAQEIAALLSREDLSKTQLRAAYSAARRLDRAGPEEVRRGVLLVTARLSYLTERSYQASQRDRRLAANYAGMTVLHKMMQQAARLVLADPAQQSVRATRLLELFQALLAYQGLGRTNQANVLRPIEAAEQAEMEQIMAGDGATTFKLAETVARQSEREDLSRSQLRNIYTILKTLQAAALTEENSWKLRLLEPRMLYVLSREQGLIAVVRTLRNGLLVLYAKGAPDQKQLDNYVRLAEALVGLQIYERYQIRQNQRPPTADLENILKELVPAIQSDDGQALNNLAHQTARLVAEADLSRGQVRNLYNTVEELAQKGFDSASLNELPRLRATLRYATTRETKLRALSEVLEKLLDQIFETGADQQKRALWLADFFEAVVAWQTVFVEYKKAHKRLDTYQEREPTDDQKEKLKNALKGDGAATIELAEQMAKDVTRAVESALKPLKPDTASAEKGAASDDKELSSGQLRTIFAMLREEALLARVARSEPEQAALRRRLWLILPRLAYAAARLPGVAPIEMIARTGLEKVLAESSIQLDPLVDLLEAIVAFYYINKE
jgi:CRISPR type III-A-associated protein Csm2